MKNTFGKTHYQERARICETIQLRKSSFLCASMLIMDEDSQSQRQLFHPFPFLSIRIQHVAKGLSY